MSEIIELSEGVKLHLINTDKFKTSVVSVFLTTKLTRENVTKEALIPAVLRRGTNNITTQQELNKALEEMYGASFNCGIEKRGDNHVLKFYIEAINDEYTLKKEKILDQSIEFIFDIVLNPLTQNHAFSAEYVRGEKENLKNIIEGKIDNKTTYAYIRCLEEMFQGKEFGLYDYGYIEDLNEINEKNLYQYYQALLTKCKIDIFVSGKIQEQAEIQELIRKIITEKYLLSIKGRKAKYAMSSQEKVDQAIEEKVIEEKMDITQGKLVIGVNINNDGRKMAAASAYNAILGGGANSKLFQNVREKASLAYTAGSGYLKTKNIIAIRCGIEIKNYSKAVEIIRQQLQDMKDGKFSVKDIENAKELIIAGMQVIKDEQTSEVSYEFSQELTNNSIDIDDFIVQIRNVRKEEIVEIANEISINTIYFLRN